MGKFDKRATIKRPHKSKLAKFMNEMKNDFNDYDVYLWGSFPEKKTWDVDLLAYNPDVLSSEEMERIFLNSFDSALINNRFLVDLGFTDMKIDNFGNLANKFIETGKTTPTRGFVYADKWWMNDKLMKNRHMARDVTNGSLESVGHNVWLKRSEIPYKKMISSLYTGRFDQYYKHKPILIKERKKIYG